MGGGGRGMRVVENAEGLDPALDQARREAADRIRLPDVFLEKFIRRPSTSRSSCWAISTATSFTFTSAIARSSGGIKRSSRSPRPHNLDPSLRQAICDAALAIGRKVGYENAGTVEFLVDDESGTFYFIEVNPRLQVEHTVTEIVTGVDLVKSQILIAQGRELADPEIGITSQDSIQTQGHRDPVPDHDRRPRPTTSRPTTAGSRIIARRAARDCGSTAARPRPGAIITPFYDSLLVKVSTYARRFEDAARRMERALQEYPHSRGEDQHPVPAQRRRPTRLSSKAGAPRGSSTRRPNFSSSRSRQDRATQAARPTPPRSRSTAFPGVKPGSTPAPGSEPEPPPYNHLREIPDGSRQRFQAMGAEAFSRWIREQEPLLVTDTTFRDAHQSLLATRLRTRDMLRVADAYAHLLPGLFSIEMWGGATFDTAMRFLKEDPWERLAQLREKIPNILFQMLIRGSNAVGYTSYPDNVVSRLRRRKQRRRVSTCSASSTR